MNARLTQTLTRKLLQSLPEGACVISNIGSPPVFATCLAALDDRAELWAQAKKAGAAGQLCLVTGSRIEARLELRMRSLRRVNATTEPC